MIDVSKVDNYTLNILKEHGWYPNREYDISFWKELLSQEGYICFDLADRLLKSLGGITVNVSGDRTHMSATFDFNPLKAASGEFDRLQDFENAANEKLYPIGSMVQAIAYVGERGAIYWGDWKNFCLMGESIEEYLNNIFDLNFKPKYLQFKNL